MKLRFDHPAWRQLSPVLARGLVRVFLGSIRANLEGDQEGRALIQSEAPVIFTTWHCHLLAPLYFAKVFCREKPPIVLMASPSRDGEFIADVARGLGFLVCPGSRRKGGFQALQQMASYVRQGHSAGVVADGSRGPARVAQKGVLYLARETLAPIIPVAVASSRKLTLNTWDRFELPLPFGQMAFLVDAPVRIGPQDRGDALEARRQYLEVRLNRLFQGSQDFFPKK
jgi:lysophospholipid acyltransferase (LPLAT)-like uncharacterized protein